MTNSEFHTVNLPFPDKGDRRVWIYVPEHNKNEKLPVVYMTDGQNLFDDNATPFGSWEVVHAVENEIKNDPKVDCCSYTADKLWGCRLIDLFFFKLLIAVSKASVQERCLCKVRGQTVQEQSFLVNTADGGDVRPWNDFRR